MTRREGLLKIRLARERLSYLSAMTELSTSERELDRVESDILSSERVIAQLRAPVVTFSSSLGLAHLQQRYSESCRGVAMELAGHLDRVRESRARMCDKQATLRAKCHESAHRRERLETILQEERISELRRRSFQHMRDGER